MKKISLHVKSQIVKLSVGIKRFPETILLATLTVITLIYMNHLDYGNLSAREDLTRIAMVLAIGIPISLCIKVIFERKLIEPKRIKLITYLVATAAVVIYYFLLKDMNKVSISRYIAFSISLYLTFSFIPYFYKKKNYELYVITLFNRFITPYLYSIILFLGLIAIIFTINVLFTANISSRIYFDIWLVVAGVFAPVFFLSDIPKYAQNISLKEYSKVLKVLILYIVMPLIVVYSTILYIYFGKIVITAQWPGGILADLVLWFSIISTIVIFFIYPLKETNQWANKFIVFFPKLILPLLIIMFVSLAIRIRAYGITENRYFVLIAGLWVTGCMLYYTIIKNPKNIVFTISLSIISVLAVIGPLSSFSVSKLSQNIRFEKILENNNMIFNKEIVTSSDVSKEDKKQISSILLYFENNHNIEDLRYIPKDFKISQTKDIFGFELEQDYYAGLNDKYFNYHAKQDGGFVNIKSYDYFVDYTSYNRGINTKNVDKEYSVLYSEDNNKLEVIKDNNIIYSIDINSIIEEIYKKVSKDNIEKYEVDIKDMMYNDSNPYLDVLFVFNNISGSQSYDDKIIIYRPMFYIFIKIK